MLAEALYRPDTLTDTRSAGEYCRAELALAPAEALVVVLLDNRHRA